jgi:hypothetical protein
MDEELPRSLTNRAYIVVPRHTRKYMKTANTIPPMIDIARSIFETPGAGAGADIYTLIAKKNRTIQ